MNEESVTLYYGIMDLLELMLMFGFYTKLAGRRIKPGYCLAFTSLAGAGVLCLQGPPLLKLMGIGALLLSGGRFLYGLPWKKAALYAVAALEAIYLCYGIVNSLTDMLLQMISRRNPEIAGSLAMLAGGPVALALTCLCCRALLRYLPPFREYVLTVLALLLMIFMVSGYIDQDICRVTIHAGRLDLRHMGASLLLLSIRLLGVVSLFCVGRIYRRLADSLEANGKIPLLEQAVQDQRQYVAEMQARYENTVAFRHDLKNHVLVLKGLLDRGDGEAAEKYLEKVEECGRELSFPCHTGHPVLDILIGNKLGEAKRAGIKGYCTLRLPPGGVDDMDLGILVSNALDNAVHACERLAGEEKGFVNISGYRRGDFFLIRVENTYNGKPLPPEGTGLWNIRRTAAKYNGTVEIKQEGSIFTLSILLVSEHSFDQ